MKKRIRTIALLCLLLTVVLCGNSFAGEVVIDYKDESIDTSQDTEEVIFKAGGQEIPDPGDAKYLDEAYLPCKEEQAAYEVIKIVLISRNRLNEEDTKEFIKEEVLSYSQVTDPVTGEVTEHKGVLLYYKTSDSYRTVKEVQLKKYGEEEPKEPVTTRTVTVLNNGDGTASAQGPEEVSGSVIEVEEGSEITLTAEPNEGFRFKEWEVQQGDVTIEEGVFTVGAEDVRICAVFEPVPRYKITMITDGNGKAAPSAALVPEGTEVSLSVKPNDGYRFSWWQVTAGGVKISGGKITVQAEDVEIHVYFEPVPAEPAEPEEPMVYQIISGMNSVWAKGTEDALILTANGELAKFRELIVDGSVVENGYYQVEEGPTVLALSASFRETLSEGAHAVAFRYEDGQTEDAIFTVVREEETEPEPVAPEEDSYLWTLWILLGVSAIATVGAFISKKRRGV